MVTHDLLDPLSRERLKSGLYEKKRVRLCVLLSIHKSMNDVRNGFNVVRPVLTVGAENVRSYVFLIYVLKSISKTLHINTKGDKKAFSFLWDLKYLPISIFYNDIFCVRENIL